MTIPNTMEGARQADAADPLASYREQFLFPQNDAEKVLYFTGNSLGLQARRARTILMEELDDWARWGVDGHLEAERPWLAYHENFSAALARIVGAKESEVVAMNGLTTNLHLMMVSFYRPQGKRTKILCEGKAFPSDQYALHSQLRFHGLDPAEHLIEIMPDPETELIEEDRIIEAIDAHRDELALVMIGGVNYYTGQWFDMERITDAGKRAGAMVGWDLAHAAGNVPLELHKWNVDFAAWCGYKYLNSGPGGVSGVFVHEKHHGKADIPRFEGWWGHNKEDRFQMPDRFVPISTAEAWQLSNAPVMAMAPLLASLELYEEVGMTALREKSLKLTAYLQAVIEDASRESGQNIRIITPKDAKRRGCQISISVPGKGKAAFKKLSEAGVIADWREPDVIRLAPVPLYNSFEDVYRFGQLLKEHLRD
ncbi:kynureninase [Croceimicrobium hydrocarbonivorans]|uniref:Kynureninase n=1 Tax=Croceimicrobium hydrocarbonivorans TaxID=2761580 RepID=A0A7H0VHU5_9FLAO|nr:kynureninase [Croceimicrobium hydrocarbonivorans]QNR25293.1 kynureninase [Croceimicrobium hydrocarbonivorans]